MLFFGSLGAVFFVPDFARDFESSSFKPQQTELQRFIVSTIDIEVLAKLIRIFLSRVCIYFCVYSSFATSQARMSKRSVYSKLVSTIYVHFSVSLNCGSTVCRNAIAEYPEVKQLIIESRLDYYRAAFSI